MENRRASASSSEEVGSLNLGSSSSTFLSLNLEKMADICFCLSGVDTDELDSNVDDWEEETIEFFINEEIIPLGDL